MNIICDFCYMNSIETWVRISEAAGRHKGNFVSCAGVISILKGRIDKPPA